MTRNRWSLKVGTTSGQQWRQPSLHPALALRLLILPQSLFPLFLLWFILSLFACLCLLVCSSLSYSLFIFSIFIIRSFSFSLPFHFFTHSLANPFFTSFSSISVHSSFCASSSLPSSTPSLFTASRRQETHYKPRPAISTKFTQGQKIVKVNSKFTPPSQTPVNKCHDNVGAQGRETRDRELQLETDMGER